MRKIISTLFFLLMAVVYANGQMLINSDTFRSSEYDVAVTVIDSLSNEPMGFVTVYLKAKGDTLITNFSLSDQKGKAEFKEVNRGSYILYAEMLGYKTVEKVVYISKDDGELSVIKMVESPELIDAATISAIGNPIEIRQDTIIYNAYSYKVADNAMLEDLLKKMPGIEVKDGSVTVNGEAVSRITVGGRTFFFDDKSMALKNLPAKIVDKIKVIDKNEESAEFSGIVRDKEKVLDVEVKKEFSKGWFGNISGSGGTSLAAKDDAADRLITNRDFLYQANGMASYYNDTDQLTIVGNAYNVTSSSDYMLYSINNDGEDHPRGGLPLYTQLGANYNSVKPKNLELASTVNYKHAVSDVNSSVIRTSFLSSGDEIRNDNKNSDLFGEHTGEIIFNLKNRNRDKFLFVVNEQITFNAVDRTTGSDNFSSDKSGSLNSSSANSYLKSNFLLTRTDFSLGWKNIGKARRVISLDGAFFLSNKGSGSKEYSKTWIAIGGNPELRDLYYKGNNRDLGYKLNLSYVEPLSESWSIVTSLYSFASFKDTYKNAFDRTSGESQFTPTIDDAACFTKANDYYSSLMDNDYLYIKERLEAQYNMKGVTLQFGVTLQETYNRTYSKSLGVAQTAGQNEWLLDWSPFLQFRWMKEQQNLYISYSGSSTQQSPSMMMPVLNIAVPTSLSMGNIYLLPSFGNNASFSYRASDKKTFSHIYAYAKVEFVSRGIVNASWFDFKGVSYRIPVNTKKPSFNSMLNFQWGRPLNAGKTWSINISPYFIYNRSVSYQSTERLAAIDPDTFDYYAFMKKFWGSDPSGDIFYSGGSGFKESLTNRFNTGMDIRVNYSGEHFALDAGISADNTITRYSLDGSANQNLWSVGPRIALQYMTEKGFNAGFDAYPSFYFGYSDGARKPFINLSARISKDIKAFNIGLQVDNILNQNNFVHVILDNYVQDSYSTSFGRFFLISLKYNFGKLNQAKQGKAQMAAFQLGL